jgi:hypothetical protein
MPSEDRIQSALEALAGPRETFRSAVATAVEQVGAYIRARRAPTNGRDAVAAQELGSFSAGRLDAGRFAALFGHSGTADPQALGRVERAYDALLRVLERGDDLFVVRVADAGDLHAAVARALGEAGKAFGAARAVELARQGRAGAEAEVYTGGFAPRSWNRAEREIAPPLVVEVDGGDLQVGGLAEFLAGGQKIVLLVRGAAPAAPLVRLLTPGVFVMQTGDAGDLTRLAGVAGPALCAVMPEGTARFVHVPGTTPVSQRIAVEQLPADQTVPAVGSFTSFQQREELGWLRALATAPTVATAPAAIEGEKEDGRAGEGARASEAEGETVDRLAAWLLSQTDLTGT